MPKKTKYVQNNLSAGELSPLLEGRTDIEKYFASVGTMRNWLPMVQGGVTRRPGFHFADYLKYQDMVCRLIPFEYGTTQAYVVEVGHQYMRFWMDGYLIRQVTGGDLITNGAFSTDLAGWTDYSDPPGTVIWETAKAKLNGGADGEGSIGQGITTTSGKTYLLTFDVSTNPLHIRIGTSAEGSQIVYDVQYSVGSKQITFIARGTTTYIQFLRKSDGAAYLDNVVCKEYAPVEILTSPYAESELSLLKWAQNTNNLFIVHPSYNVRILTRTSSTVWTLTEVEFEDGPYFEEVVSSTITPSATIGNIYLDASAPIFNVTGHVGALWRILHGTTWGYVQLVADASNSTTHFHATVKKTLGGITASNAHREGRWSILRGFPCSDIFHENRLVMGGAVASPQTFWGSKSEEWDNHTPGTQDNDPISFTIGSNNVNIIHWLASARSLIVGTPGGEFRAIGGNDSPITPSNIDVKNESTNQVADRMPLRIGNAIVYIQRAGQQLLEMKYNFDSDSYEADDLTLFSEHLTKDGITELAYQRGYNPLVWVRRSDGVLLALTYNQKQLTKGWSQQPTSGTVEGMAVIPNPTDKSDDVYLPTKRTINGTPRRFMEYLDPYLNVDCGLSLSSSVPVSSISGLEHLIGEIVDIVGDGAVYPQQVVDINGQIFIDPPALFVEIGLHYDSYGKTLRPEIKGETTMGCHKRWSGVFARLFETVGLKLNGEEVPFRSSTDLMDQGITPYTGDKHIINVGWDAEGRIEFEQIRPLPATILCIFGDLEIGDD